MASLLDVFFNVTKYCKGILKNAFHYICILTMKEKFIVILLHLVSGHLVTIPYIKNLERWNEKRIIEVVDRLFILNNIQKKEEIAKWIDETCYKIAHKNYKKFCSYFILKSAGKYDSLKKYEFWYSEIKFILKLLIQKKIRLNHSLRNILLFFINKSQDEERLQYLKLFANSPLRKKGWSFIIFIRIKENHLTISRYKEKFLRRFLYNTFFNYKRYTLFYNTLPNIYKRYLIIYLYYKSHIVQNRDYIKKLILFFLKKNREKKSIENYYIAWQVAIKFLPANLLKRYLTKDIIKDRQILAYIIYYERQDLVDISLKKEITIEKKSLFGKILGSRILRNRVVLKALLWFLTTQENDGFWSCSKNNPFHNNFGLPHFAGYEDLWYDISVTGLTILAFTSAGINHYDKNIFGKVISKSKEWILSNQSENGSIDMKETPKEVIMGKYKEPISRNKHGSLSVAHIYNHNISLYALTDLYLVSFDKSLLSSIIRAYKYSITFKYPVVNIPKALNLDDIGPSIFAIIAYILLNKSGVIKDKESIKNIYKYIGLIEEKETGQTYMLSPVPKCLGNYDSTATFLTIKGLLGMKKNKYKSIEKALEFLYPHLPVWHSFYKIPKGDPKSIAESFFNDNDIVNEFYWLFGSFAFRFYDKKHFYKWYKKLAKVLQGNQRDFGIYFGSFDPEGPWAKVGGRVYMTSMAVLALQVPYLFNYRIFEK